MKKILMMLLCLALLLGAAPAQMEPAPGSPMEAYGKMAAGEKLGMDLLSMLHVSGKNTVLSPQSLALALGMAAEGAKGETLEEILAALGVQDVSEIAASLPEGLKSANAVFTAPEVELNGDYTDRLDALYQAEYFDIDADVVENVNAWVKEHTDGLIEQMLTEAPAEYITMMLVNAVAMDEKWASPFAAEATYEDVFHAMDRDLMVEMMHQTAHFDYAEKDGMQIVRLPYEDGKLEMWIALPPEGGVFQLLEILANDGMFYLKSDAQRREVILSLPKVDVSDDNSLADALKLLGIGDAFSENADYSGISGTPLCIDEIFQKARIQIDEEGTRAAAATMMMMRAMGARPDEEPVVMNVNRPFVFVISDAESGSVCFAGVVENPTEE